MKCVFLRKYAVSFFFVDATQHKINAYKFPAIIFRCELSDMEDGKTREIITPDVFYVFKIHFGAGKGCNLIEIIFIEP